MPAVCSRTIEINALAQTFQCRVEELRAGRAAGRMTQVEIDHNIRTLSMNPVAAEGRADWTRPGEFLPPHVGAHGRCREDSS